MIPKIETERILLREFNLADAEDVFAFGSNKQVAKYTGDPLLKSVAEASEIIKSVWFNDYKNYGYGRWAAIYKPTNKVIGFAGLKYLPEFNETDIGFRFLPEFWGKGLATEVCNPIITYGFEQLKLKQIIGIAMPDNVASNKVLKKIGMTFFKTDDYNGDGGAYNWYKIENKLDL